MSLNEELNMYFINTSKNFTGNSTLYYIVPVSLVGEEWHTRHVVLMLIWWIACWMRSQSSWGGFFVVIMMLFCVCTGRLCLFSICVLICGSTLCVVWGELFQSSFPKAWEHAYFLASTVSSTFFCWMCSGNNLHVLCILRWDVCG